MLVTRSNFKSVLDAAWCLPPVSPKTHLFFGRLRNTDACDFSRFLIVFEVKQAIKFK